MQKLLDLSITSSLPVVTGNFEEIKTELAAKLKQFDLIVDENSIKTAKTMATQINKVSGNIDSLRITKVKELSAPIKAFEEKAKELTTLCQISRQKLLTQVKVFEDKTREECLSLLQEELAIQYSKLGIRDEFKTVTVEDLATVSNKTKTGIAKKAKDAVDERVMQVKYFQEKIDTRLLTLEGTCYKSGLQAPLTRENINHFLMEPEDEAYETKLESLISNEISRLEVMAKQIKDKAEKEAAIAATKTVTQAKQPQVHIESPKPVKVVYEKYANFKNNEFAVPSNKKSYTVTATFEIEVDEKYEANIEATLLKKFKDAKFKTIPTIHVSKGVADEQSAA